MSSGLVLSKLNENGHEAYLVGGCVRDTLLGRQPKDWDIATSATPEQVKALFPEHLELGASFGVISVKLGGVYYEVATFRNDGQYSDGRHPDSVAYTLDPFVDASRRDFTINAIYLDRMGKITDFFTGEQDLLGRVIRTVGDPNTRFSEDPLRILRAIRFATTLDFDIHNDVSFAIERNKELLKLVSWERIREELLKILVSDNARRGLVMLYRHSLLKVILPEVEDYFPFLNIIEKTWSTREMRLAAMFSSTPVEVAKSVMTRLRLDNVTIDFVLYLIGNLEFMLKFNCHTIAERRRKMEGSWFPALVEFALAVADDREVFDLLFIRAAYRGLDPEVLRPAPLITGKDLIDLGLQPGPVFSKILNDVRDMQFEGVITSREKALDFVQESGYTY